MSTCASVLAGSPQQVFFKRRGASWGNTSIGEGLVGAEWHTGQWGPGLPQPPSPSTLAVLCSVLRTAHRGSLPRF